MTASLKIAFAQLNPTVGDVPGNLAKARKARADAAAQGADIILFSELFLVGYPPEDLVLKPALQADARAATEALAKETASGPAVLIGTPWLDNEKLYNAFAYLDGGAVKALRYKVDLPNYGVFDEKRVFTPGPLPGPIDIRGVRIGVPICEDIWKGDVVECIAETGGEFLLVPNGSPYEASKEEVRLNIAVSRVVESGLALAYLNQIGGQDELVFDGASFVINPDRSLAMQMPAWEEALTITNWRRDGARWICEPCPKADIATGLEAVYRAMMLGLGDYVRKNRFPGVVLGLSGGIDSALTAAVAADALGPENVRCVMMPSRYTSKDSLDDAAGCARLLGAHLDNVPIEDAVKAFGAMTTPLFAGRAPDTTEENIQSRIRGVTLMAISNKFGPMVVTTGNKSEMSVGYATLYGDMCGGYNVLKDIYKMQVFALSKWRNQHKPKGAKGPDGRVMPERVITKPPTAELRANQKDEDSLPPYPKLDDILECLVENEMPVEDIMKRGHDLATIKRVEHLLSIAEYKRRQAPPGVKITRKNFGRDRRYPITNAFRDAT
ncbi:MAG: NAD+ synthase [Alphaproteobacteria bacterium]|nr:NAD+ synthase [Alphaproteobacteria bacterium]